MCARNLQTIIINIQINLTVLCALTRIYEQCVQITDTKIVAKIPRTKPHDLNANGIDNMPVPRDAFSKCVSVSQSLKKQYIHHII